MVQSCTTGLWYQVTVPMHTTVMGCPVAQLVMPDCATMAGTV